MAEIDTSNMYGKYTRAIMMMKAGGSMGQALLDIDSRLNELERKAFPELQREQASKTQRTLILHHLGLLDGFRSLDTSVKNRAKILSVVIDCDPDVEKVLNSIVKNDPKVISYYNYTFLVEFFEKYGLDKQAHDCQKILDKIIANQD